MVVAVQYMDLNEINESVDKGLRASCLMDSVHRVRTSNCEVETSYRRGAASGRRLRIEGPGDSP